MLFEYPVHLNYLSVSHNFILSEGWNGQSHWEFNNTTRPFKRRDYGMYTHAIL